MSNTQVLWIPAVLPGQNAIIDAAKTVRVRGRGAKKQIWSKYAQLKASWTEYIRACVGCSLPKLEPKKSAHFFYVISEPTKKRDPSNAGMGAIKFIEDALQVAGVIPNDGWGNVLSISLTFLHSPETPGVLVILSDTRISEGEALKLYGENAVCSTTNNPVLKMVALKMAEKPKRARKKAHGRFGKKSRSFRF